MNTNNTTKSRFAEWDEFDPEEYAVRNYGRKILDEDRLIIGVATKVMLEQGLKPRSLQRVADVGTGPNLYPAMLLAPFVAPEEEDGRLELIEFSAPNRSYLESVVSGKDATTALAGVWDKFETLMASQNQIWKGALRTVREKSRIIAGDIYTLPPLSYDAISSYFVTESITDSRIEFEKATSSLLSAVKPGGFVMIAHMLGSVDWYAGEDKLFPATPLTLDDLYKFYQGRLDATIVQPQVRPEVRPGYHGMAIVTGRKLK